MDDIADTLAPNSAQLDAIDLANRPPMVVTVTKVDVNPNPLAEQPVTVHLAEFDRPWKPGKNMRRVLGYCWGTKSSAWIGHHAEIYNDESVSFGKERTGGIRISRLSHIDGPKEAPILLSQGRPGTWKVKPLPAAPAEPTPEELAGQVVAALAAATTEGEVREWGNRAHAKNLLDVQVKGETVRNHVTYRLAELAEIDPATANDPALDQ